MDDTKQPTRSPLPDLEDVQPLILKFCESPRTKEEILNLIQVEVTPANYMKYLRKLRISRLIQPIDHRFLKAPGQKYVISIKGQVYLKAIDLNN